MKYYKPIYTVLFLFLFTFLAYGQDRNDGQIQIPNRENGAAQIDKPYVILISIDGFRYDYFDKYKPPFFLKMRKKGVAAKAMIPSFPSVTFPNHYTLVTGMLPPHHGLIGNNIYDPATKESYSLRNAKAVQNPNWYGGIPIWSLAERQNLLSACYYWPGSEAPIGGYYPTYYYPYSEATGVVKRIDKVVEWLKLPKEKRPHLITFYMPQVDHAGHSFGPESLETASAVRFVDSSIKRLYEEVKKTGVPVNFILVSDHGMAQLDVKHPLELPGLDADRIEKTVNNGTYASIFVKDKGDINKVYQDIKNKSHQGYTPYLKKDVPEKYEFSSAYDTYNRAGDIILIAEAPQYFSRNGSIPQGSHGFLPKDTPEMKTIFTAWGPDIKRRKNIASFKNIHVFPLLAHLLDLDYDTNAIDGDDRLVKEVLK